MSQPHQDKAADGEFEMLLKGDVFEYGRQRDIPILNNISEAVPQFATETMEEEQKDSTQDSQSLIEPARASTPSDMATILAPELASFQAPYYGEDSRITQLRHLDDQLQQLAAPYFEDRLQKQKKEQKIKQVGFSVELARLYQLTTRGAIQVIEDCQRHKGQCERDLEELKSRYERLQLDNSNTHAHLAIANGK
ncbi:hypothetical protein DL98DRAFT_520906 [Cadophora sp. DSE1049]|nr:hypothetical protein DL98DRAFT_520906 [Cadophora sp. DSE1049]